MPALLRDPIALKNAVRHASPAVDGPPRAAYIQRATTFPNSIAPNQKRLHAAGGRRHNARNRE
jgi:hypothetical protein